MASKPVNLSALMNDTKRTISKKASAPKPSDDRAHNLKEVKEDMSRIKSVAKSQGSTTGFKDHASNRVTYHNSNGTTLVAKPNANIKKNPIKKK